MTNDHSDELDILLELGQPLEVEDRVRQDFKLLMTAWAALRSKLTETGVEDALIMIPPPEMAEYKLNIDPFDRSETLTGTWRNTTGEKLGELLIRGDKGVYAEFDVIRNHPSDVRWFVEAVTAWGSLENMKSELRLLPAI